MHQRLQAPDAAATAFAPARTGYQRIADQLTEPYATTFANHPWLKDLP